MQRALTSEIILVNEKIYVGTGFGAPSMPEYGTYSINADNGSLVWHLLEPCSESRAYSEDDIYLLDVVHEEAKIYCLKTEDGKLSWRYVLTFNKFLSFFGGYPGAITILDGKIYLNIYTSPEKLNGKEGHQSHYVLCLNVEDQSIVWNYEIETVSFTLSQPVYCAIPIAHGKVYAFTSPYIYCLDAKKVV